MVIHSHGKERTCVTEVDAADRGNCNHIQVRQSYRNNGNRKIMLMVMIGILTVTVKYHHDYGIWWMDTHQMVILSVVLFLMLVILSRFK